MFFNVGSISSCVWDNTSGRNKNHFNLIDIWRYTNPTVKKFTWKNRSESLQSRIDYWLISDPLSEYVSTVKTLPTPLRGHKTIFLELCMSPSHRTKRVNSYWKLNNSLIEVNLW